MSNITDALDLADTLGEDGACMVVFGDERDELATALCVLAEAYRSNRMDHLQRRTEIMIENVDDGFGEVFRQEWRCDAPGEGLGFVVLKEEWVVDPDNVPRRIIHDVSLVAVRYDGKPLRHFTVGGK